MGSVISKIWINQFWGIRDYPALQGNAIQGNALADSFLRHGFCSWLQV